MRNYTKFCATDAHLLIICLQESLNPQNWKAKQVMGKTWPAKPTLSEHTPTDASHETGQPETSGKRRLLMDLSFRKEPLRLTA